MGRIVEMQKVYGIEGNITLEEALYELIDEGENFGYDGDFILKIDNETYLFNFDVMNQKGVDWNKDKAVEYIKVHRM
jgi:hypothetical protein